MKLSLCLLLIGTILCQCAVAVATTPIRLAEDGQPKAVIVIPDASDRTLPEGVVRMQDQAAKVLADHVLQVSGAKLSIVSEAELGSVQVADGRIVTDKKIADAFVLIGESALSKRLGVTLEGLEPSGMRIKSTGNSLCLLGVYDSTPYTGGSIYAVNRFLETLGCRYLWPGAVGKVVPQRRTIDVPPIDVQFNPLLKQRNMRDMSPVFERIVRGAESLGYTKEAWIKLNNDARVYPASYVIRGSDMGWQQWQNLGGDIGIRGGHSFGSLYDRFGKDHPEWFALQPNGSRAQKSSERARLCISNVGLIDQIAADMIKALDEKPDTKTMPLSPNDGGADTFCMCEACKALDAPNGPVIKNFYGWNYDYVSLTDRYVWFYNQIAERVTKVHPNVLFTIDAYSVYSTPPVERTLHPNMVLRFVPTELDDWEAWKAKVSKIYWRPNMLSGPWREGMLEFRRRPLEDVQYVAHNGAIAIDVDSVIHNWATHGLMYYVLARKTWEPDLAIDAIIDDYCQSGFGPAAKPVREYFARLEQVMSKWDTREAYARNAEMAVSHRVDPFVANYTPDAIAGLRQCLDDAAKAAANDEPVRNRIAFLRVGLDWTDVQVRAYRLLIDQKQGKPVDLAVAESVMRERDDMMRAILTNNPMAVNVAYVTYGDMRRWDPLREAIKQHQKSSAAKTGAGGEKKGTVTEADEEGKPIELPGR